MVGISSKKWTVGVQKLDALKLDQGGGDYLATKFEGNFG